ncbi:hypothetical protein SPBR_01966 [Sporothrix brasiliensis 5110]|uniref:Extracellular membrane protein CFEM domain-containing protein n=1 Tax=Sporothrix brasiliensis 5110 TaxID=1398154 RepID=A0A0C2IX27_9PEZI|nr:uncharacterized protein SPBR_01966 [Sporothrix brasiliensis 5110]KIH91315.1 hypothetical protein SPBR_01966 [Sporothrix brasiliensis 5110]
MPSQTTARQRAFALAAAVTSLSTLASASSTKVAFSGCLGLCVNHNGCGARDTSCVCAASAQTAFLGDVVSCVAQFCLLSNGDASAATANSVIGTIDAQFVEVVADVCAADKQSVPASRISAALSSASSLVSAVLGVAPTATGGTTTITTHATTTIYRSTHTAQAKTTKTLPNGGATFLSSTLPSAVETTTSATTAPSPPPATSSPAPEPTPATTSDQNDTTSTSTTKTAATATKDAPARDTTDSSPFTNTREDSAARALAPVPWQVVAAAALPLLLTLGTHLL